ncbi:MAG: hypothetical protein ACI9BH_000798 [Paracoccaceae bacterium]|jgi:hypothetical protein
MQNSIFGIAFALAVSISSNVLAENEKLVCSFLIFANLDPGYGFAPSVHKSFG